MLWLGFVGTQLYISPGSNGLALTKSVFDFMEYKYHKRWKLTIHVSVEELAGVFLNSLSGSTHKKPINNMVFSRRTCDQESGRKQNFHYISFCVFSILNQVNILPIQT